MTRKPLVRSWFLLAAVLVALPANAHPPVTEASSPVGILHMAQHGLLLFSLILNALLVFRLVRMEKNRRARP